MQIEGFGSKLCINTDYGFGGEVARLMMQPTDWIERRNRLNLFYRLRPLTHWCIQN